MGKRLSKNKKPISTTEIEKRLLNLENLDQNRDGIITRDEVSAWMEEHEHNLEELHRMIKSQHRMEQLKHQKELIDARHEINDLQKQVDALKKMNHQLEIGKDQSTKKIDVKENHLFDHEQSRINISELVDSMLEDENINIRYLPDWVERKIYINIFTMLLNTINEITSGSQIDVLGHRIKFDLEPINKGE